MVRGCSRILFLAWLLLGGEPWRVAAFTAGRTTGPSSKYHRPEVFVQRGVFPYNYLHSRRSATGAGRDDPSEDKIMAVTIHDRLPPPTSPLSKQPRSNDLAQKAAKLTQQLDNINGNNSATSTIMTSLLDLMMDYARLGKAQEAETLYRESFLLPKQPPTDNSSIVPPRMALLRCLLQAWSQRLRIVPKNLALETQAEQKATQTLRQMILLASSSSSANNSNNHSSGNNNATTTRLDASDFATMMQNYLYLDKKIIVSTTNNDKDKDKDTIYNLWNIWQEQSTTTTSPVDPPTARLAARILRHYAKQLSTTTWNTNNNANIIRNTPTGRINNPYWEDVLQTAERAMTFGRTALTSPTNRTTTEEDKLLVYNAMLEVWAKVLPPPSKQQQTRRIQPYQRDWVGQQTRILREEMQGIVLSDFQTYATTMYAYCKSAWLRPAWEVWTEWKHVLLSSSTSHDTPRPDPRCLQMLMQSSLRQAQEEPDITVASASGLFLGPLDHAHLVTRALYDRWELYDQGYHEFKPDLNLYTSLVRCWANPSFSLVAMEPVHALVTSLDERLLQADMAFYKGWMAVVRGQFGNHPAIDVEKEAARMVHHMETKNPSVTPDTSVYNFLMDACLVDRSVTGVARAEQTLGKRMLVPNGLVGSPNGRSFASVIRAWLPHDTSKAEQWLDRMEERFVPSSGLFQEVILQCCEETTTAPKKDGAERRKQAERAHRLLNRMEELAKATSTDKLRPDPALYDRVMAALGRCGGAENDMETLRNSQNELYPTVGAKENTHSMIQSNEDVFRALKNAGCSLSNEDDRPLLQADTFSFNKIIRDIAKARVSDAGRIAEEIFVFMLDQYLNKANVNLKPDLVTFNSVILAHSRSARPESAKVFLDSLEELHEGGMLIEIKPDQVSYNTVIHAFHRSSSPSSGQEAELVFNELCRKMKPDAISLSSLLSVYAVRGDPYRAEELLLQFYKLHNSDRQNTAPDTTCFDQVLLAWAKKGGEMAARRAEMLLKLMEDMAAGKNPIVSPTTRTYNIVLHALSRSGDTGAPFRAQLLLERMKNKRVRPDAVTYTTLIAVTCRLGTRSALATVESLLDEAINSPYISTDCALFANILASLALCPQQGTSSFARSLIDHKMPALGIVPDIFCWNGLLNCLAKRGLGEAAEEVLGRLESGPLRPTSQSYSIVLDAHAKSQLPDSIASAENLIQRMEDSEEFKPDAMAYTALIQKYARSNVPMKANRAQQVLQRMKEGSSNGREALRPTVVTFNALLNACEYTNSTDLKEKEEAFTVACVTFDEVRQELKPTHTTYGTFLGVVSRLMPKSDARNEIAELVFRRCCKDGQVSQYVLRKLKTTVPLSLYRQMLRGRTEDKLPRSWTANVRERPNESFVGWKKSKSTNRSASFANLYS